MVVADKFSEGVTIAFSRFGNEERFRFCVWACHLLFLSFHFHLLNGMYVDFIRWL
jgi:hypothetical protein